MPDVFAMHSPKAAMMSQAMCLLSAVIAMCYVSSTNASPDSKLKLRWKEVTQQYGIWGVGMNHER